MSKGNMLLGYARGKMGDIVFARVKGQQIQRPRNRQPNNPRSSQQMYQRSLFACAVSFFSKGRQALFQYAFESKKSTESDYNAFIRLNAKNGVHMTKDMLDNIYYPKLGNYIMTQGSLPGYESQFLASERKFCCFLTDVQSAAAADDITIGEISQQLIASGNYEYGDIITILQIKSDCYFEEGSDPIPVVWEEGKPVRWILDQFILNPNSTTKVNTVLRNVKVSKRDVELDDTVTIESSALSSAYDEIGGFCVVHSRKTSSGLKVSTTTLTNSTGAQLALAKCATQEYIDYVLVDWQSRAEAILEGSLSPNESASVPDFTPALPIMRDVAANSELILTNLSIAKLAELKEIFEGGSDADADIYVGQGVYNATFAQIVDNFVADIVIAGQDDPDSLFIDGTTGELKYVNNSVEEKRVVLTTVNI